MDLRCLLPSSSPWSYNPGFPSEGEDDTPGEVQIAGNNAAGQHLQGQTQPNTPLANAASKKQV